MVAAESTDGDVLKALMNHMRTHTWTGEESTLSVFDRQLSSAARIYYPRLAEYMKELKDKTITEDKWPDRMKMRTDLYDILLSGPTVS